MPEDPTSSLRALRILSFLATQANPVSAVRRADAIDAPRSSTFRLLRGMQSLGFVTHLPELQAYALGIAALEIGQAFGIQVPPARFGRPVLERLVHRLGETAHLAVLNGHETLYIHEETSPSRPALVTAKNVRLPAHLTASGQSFSRALNKTSSRPSSRLTTLLSSGQARARRRTPSFCSSWLPREGRGSPVNSGKSPKAWRLLPNPSATARAALSPPLPSPIPTARNRPA